MDVYEFAHVTYFTNVPLDEHPTDEDAEEVAAQVAELFSAKLRQGEFADDLSITKIEFELGCILTSITIGVTATAIYKFIKDYPKFRPGLLLLVKDLNGAYVKIKGRLQLGSTCVMREDLPDAKELAALSDSVKNNKLKPARISKRPTQRARTRKD